MYLNLGQNENIHAYAADISIIKYWYKVLDFVLLKE